MTDIKILEQKVRELTGDKRYNHSLGVRDEAMKLAERYGADIQKAEIAGLVHDCVKDLKSAALRELSVKLGVKLDKVVKHEEKLMHSHIGAYYVKVILGVEDEDIFDAVYYHTTGKKKMPLLSKIIYVADFTEVNRSFPGVEQLRELSYQNLDNAMLEGLNYTINKLLTNGKMIHSDTVKARNHLIKKQKKMERWLNEY